MPRLRRLSKPVVCVLVASAAILNASGSLRADEGSAPVVFLGAKILTGTGDVYDPGALIIAAGKIAAVGPASRTNIPLDAVVYDVEGKVIIRVCRSSFLGWSARILTCGSIPDRRSASLVSSTR